MDNNVPMYQQIKDSVIALMDNMEDFQKRYPKFDMPKFSESFILSRELLKKGEFNLAVCGKVKNGKSSLINALIGKSLLPVCNDVATSRIFKISHAENEEFYIVYGNGNRKQITKEDLSLYGNQSEINKKGEQNIDGTIAYIQIYTPMEFLPKGVSLIDTPGIGSTYPIHTAITKQYIKMADAALFVMEPSPLENIEVDFLKDIADITPGVLFVTTKIDLNGNDSVENSIKRNSDIINKAVGDKLPFGINMLKMSSKLLIQAAQETDQQSSNFNYELSGYVDVKEAINEMVFTILGYYRVGLAYNSCVEHFKNVLDAMNLRLETAQKASTEYEHLRSVYDEALSAFTTNMGDTKKREVLNSIETILSTMKSDFDQTFASKGPIFAKYSEEIQALTTSGELQSYGEDLGNKVIFDLQQEWDSLTTLVQRKIADVLTSFDKDCSASIPKGIISITSDNVGLPSLQNVKLRDRISKMRNEMFMGTAITSALGTVVGGAYYFLPTIIAPVLPVVAPVLVILGIGAVVWGAISGNQKAKQEALQKNQSQLQNYVSESIANCRKQIIDVSLENNKYKSLYQGFIMAVREQALNSVNSICDKYSRELEAMKKIVTDSKQDAQLIPALNYLISAWNTNLETIQNIHNQLENVKPA